MKSTVTVSLAYKFQVLEEIHNADSGAPCSAKHVKKKQFIDSIKKALSPGHSSKAVTDAAAVTCVKLCKAATYINILDSNNVIFSLVQTVINDLKSLLFKPDKPFSRGAPYQKEDIDLMIDCFLANFRINPHNNYTLIVSTVIVWVSYCLMIWLLKSLTLTCRYF